MSKFRTILSSIKRFSVPLSFRELNASLYGPKVLANSVPKAGTHLILRFLSFLPLLTPRWQYHLDNNTPHLQKKLFAIRQGQYISGHLYWSDELTNNLRENNIRTLFIIRDLRDIVVSNFYYITYKATDHRLHSYFKSLNSDDERLMACIVGIDGKFLQDGIRSKSIGQHALSYAPWLDDSRCLTVRFEDLIGTEGGGNSEKQLKSIRSITDHLGIDTSQSQIEQLVNKIFSKKSNTFRKGRIGEWKNHFTEKHQKAFNEVAGEALIKFGYID